MFVQLLPFVAVAALVVITPGVDMALVTKNALLHGRAPAVATALGVNVGIALWTVAATLGLAALIATSAAAFTVVKLAGAAYLLYLGVQSLRASYARGADPAESSEREPLAMRTAFRQGVLSNLLNPKIAVLFTSLLPQFIGRHGGTADLLLLGGLFNTMGILWLVCYAAVAARGRSALSRPRVKRALDRATGIVLIGLGVKLTLERRG